MPDIITKEIVQANNPNLDIEDEVYRPVVGFESRYLVSNYGNVVTLDSRMNGKHLSLRIGNSGYYQIALYDKGNCTLTSIHRLVAKAFLSDVPGKDVVNHKDGNKLNNYVSNLEWCTYSENLVHAIHTGLRVQNVESMIVAGYIASCNPVLIEETGEVFESCAKCDEAKGYPREYTARMIADKAGFSTTLGYHFKLIGREDYLAVVAGTKRFEPYRYDPLEYLNKGLKHSSKCVRIVETGECFSSAVECDRKYNLVAGATSDTLKRDDKYYGKMDWHVERISDEEYIAWTKNPIVKPHTPNVEAQCRLKWCRGGYCVKVVETGECFATAKACDIHFGFPKDFTSKSIRQYSGYRPKYSPYHFVKISEAEYMEYTKASTK